MIVRTRSPSSYFIGLNFLVFIILFYFITFAQDGEVVLLMGF